MFRLMTGAVLAVAFAGFGAADDKGKKADAGKDKDAAKLSGTWVREAEGFDLRFAFQPDTLTITVKTGDNSVAVKCSYTVDKANRVKATVTGVEKKGEFPVEPKKGMEIQFTFKPDGKKAKLSDFEADGADNAKPVLEGEYEAKAD